MSTKHTARAIGRVLGPILGLAALGTIAVAAAEAPSYDWAREQRRAAARQRRRNVEFDLAGAKESLRYEEGKDYRFKDYGEISRLRLRVWGLESDLSRAEREERWA